MPRSGRLREVRAHDEEDSESASEDSSDEDPAAALQEELPEALTKLSMPKHQNPSQAQAALSKDHWHIEASICENFGPLRYMKRISFVFSDTSESVQGLLLLKTDADEQELDEGAVLMSSGIFTDLKADPSVIVNKKAAVSATKAYQQGYAWEPETTKSRTRLRKSQLGVSFHKGWLLDTMQHCKKKGLQVFDPWGGPSDLGAAVLDLSQSAEGCATGTRIFYHGRDHRRPYYEVALGRLRSIAGHMYVEKKYKMGEREPVPDPGPEPLRNKALVQSLLPGPMKVLTLSSEGKLLIPSDEELFSPLKITPTEELSDLLSQLRTEFPQVSSGAKRSAAVSAVNSDSGGPSPGKRPRLTAAEMWAQNVEEEGAEAGELPAVATTVESKVVVGTLADNRGHLEGLYKETVLASAVVSGNLHLVLTAPAENAPEGATHRLWLENVGATNLAVLPNTFIGRGGAGAFLSRPDEDILPEERAKAWTFTRITNFKNDSPKWANGGLVFSAGGGTQKPDITVATLDEIDKMSGSKTHRLYAHSMTRTGAATVTPGQVPVIWIPQARSTETALGPEGTGFNNLSLCTWLPSQEKVTKQKQGKKIECCGLMRPAFEVFLNDDVLSPSSKVTANPLCLFTSKRLELKAKQLVALH